MFYFIRFVSQVIFIKMFCQNVRILTKCAHFCKMLILLLKRHSSTLFKIQSVLESDMDKRVFYYYVPYLYSDNNQFIEAVLLVGDHQH